MIVEETEHLAVSGFKWDTTQKKCIRKYTSVLEALLCKKKCLPFDANVSSIFEDLMLHFDFDI